MEKLIKFSKSAWAIVWQSGEFAVQFKQSVCLSPVMHHAICLVASHLT